MNGPKRQYARMPTEDDGPFTKWFLTNIHERKLHYTELSLMLGCRKEYGRVFANWVGGQQKPCKEAVIAVCLAFGMKDNPDDIWELVEEEWEAGLL